MKRILPILIVICLIASVLLCLPKREDSISVFTSLDDLSGKKVGIQTGTNYDLYLKEVCPDAEPVLYSDLGAMLASLKQGKIAATLTEDISFPVEKAENPSLERIDQPVASIDNYLGISKDSKGMNLASQINEYIARYTEDGTRDELYSNWIENYDRGNTTVDKSGITGENGVVVFTAEASYEPACFAGDGGELQGFDVDFIYHFCREYGYEPDIRPLEYGAMPAALASGKCTVALGLVKDDERAEEIFYSDPYFSYSIVAAYNTDASSSKTFFENLEDSFSKTFIRESRWKMFLQGAGITLLISLLSVIFGTVTGLLIYLWCSHGKKAEQVFTNGICWLISSTPTVVLLMIFYYIVFEKYLISSVSASVVCFSLIFGCEFYERIVLGINAVGKGQEEAARAQGFTADQTFFYILFPQAAEHFLPAYQGDVITLIQETSVVGYIAVLDLTKMSDLVRGRTYEAFFPLISTACIYFLIIWIMTLIISRLSIKFSFKNRNPKNVLKDVVEIGTDSGAETSE